MDQSFLEEERELLVQADAVTTLGEFFVWLERCDDLVNRLEERSRAKRTRVSVGCAQSTVASIARLLGVRKHLYGRYVHQGGEYASTSAADGDGDNAAGELEWREIETAFKSRIATGVVINTNYIEPLRFLEDAGNAVCERVQNIVRKTNCVKVNTAFNGEFTAGDKRANKSITTKNCEIFQDTDVREWYRLHVIEPTLASLEEFQERDSGWALSRILNLLINVNKYNPMRAGCHVTLSRKIVAKKAVICVKSMDDKCLAWSVVAALYLVKQHVDRESSYPHYATVLNVEGVEFPATLKDVAKLERLNDISINVYVTKTRGKEIIVLPIRLSNEKKKRHVNLLYVQPDNNDDNDNQKVGHFACISNLSRLVSSQLSGREHRKHICDRCLHYFSSSEKLEAHVMDCGILNDCAIRLPSEDDKWLSFSNHDNKERVPFIVYADLECVLRNIDPPSSPEQTTFNYQHHEVFSVGYYVRCSYDESLSRYEYRREPDCVQWFVERLVRLAHRVKTVISNVVPMKTLSNAQLEVHENAKLCHVCENPFAADEKRVRDHCHLTGRYRGPAHSKCNLQYRDTRYIPVVFHNLSGYDAHFVIKEIATAYEGKINLLPITKEKYISFTKHVDDTAEGQDSRTAIKLRFIDSYKFLNASLDKLSSLLAKDKLRILRAEFATLSEENFNLLTRKGVFPYEYVNSVEKLNESSLPSRDSFFSSLTGDTVTESDYAHAETVWQRFSVRTLGEYSDLYLKTDVLLLADVFENFRDRCVESYGLDPAHYYTLPGFTWDAMLKHTRINFELLTDIDMVMFVERGIRGGLSQCSNRYARANNRYMRSGYDSSKPSSYIVYYDVNNLYGWAMCQPLPYADFEWVDDNDLANLDVDAIAADSPTGYILEVDLEYPASVHDAHSDLPFCPTREKPPGAKHDVKLLATLCDKKRYVIHYRNLQLCTRHGLRVTKVYRVLRFTQSAWLRDYIELNTRHRTRATNDFEKNLFKLMNNAVFGKTMENVRNRVDVRLLSQWDGRCGVEAMIAKPNFHSRSVFAENLVAVELRKLEVKFAKPIYVGMSILDISKVCLYEFHHEYMIPTFGDKCSVMYTDTDSLVYSVECDDVYEMMKRDIARFDTSDYPPDNAYGIPLANKKIPGLMKDECNGAIVTEFVGLRAKMYAIRVDGRKDTKKAKGVKSGVVARTITFDDYVRCLEDEIAMTRDQSCIRSKLHEVYTVSETKIALSPYDDKRYLVPNSTETLPWGHYRIPR